MASLSSGQHSCKFIGKKRIVIKDWFGASIWQPFHCLEHQFGWHDARNGHTLHSRLNNKRKGKY